MLVGRLLCRILPFLFVLGQPAYSQENPYTYVKMSLVVPWTLYFVFLACVLIPFVLLVVLAWSKHENQAEKQELEK